MGLEREPAKYMKQRRITMAVGEVVAVDMDSE
jgi:hypothetical protein